MPQCDFDGIFHRVFCVVLLAIAFTFTVILTNVFIDIDGLLSTKEKGKIERIRIVPESPDTNDVVTNHDERKNRFEAELFADDFNRYEDTEEPAYRTKRSLDSSDFQFRIKNPKIKKVLTNRLETLLEELDAEETRSNKLEKERLREEDKLNNEKEPATRKEVSEKSDGKERESKKEAEMLHLAMHNILLQGIIGHMDLGEAYRKVHTVVRDMDQLFDETIKEKDRQRPKSDETSKGLTKNTPSSYNVESKFLDELVNCNELQQQINEKSEQKDVLESRRSNKKKGKMLIKTVIDITSLGSEKSRENNTNTNENIRGIIKLIYNGKSIKFESMDEEEKKKEDKKKEIDKEEIIPHEIQINKNLEANDLLNDNFDHKNIRKEIVNSALEEYFKKYQNMPKNVESRRQFSGRPKRNVKVRGETTTEKIKASNFKKKDDEELYVEIETHFDSKGMKGQKKKELIRSLVEKIQKAIHADIESLTDTKKKRKHAHINKRVQNRLDNIGSSLQNKISIPFKKFEHRELHPISKAVPVDEYVPYMFDKTGKEWQKKYYGPHFLTSTKAINSGEMGEVDLEYNKVLESTGIPQRLQQPLNTDSDSLGNTIFDLGNLNFVVKELDGSGFSIGFNQYVGEAPDPESVKFFTGLHELVNDYDDKVETVTDVTRQNEHERMEFASETSHELKKRHVVRNKRHTNGVSKNDEDYHSNEYKIIFNNNFMPYDSYQEIYEDRSNKVALSVQKNVKNESYPNNMKLRNKEKPMEDLPIVIDDDFLSRHMRPSEIFGLANLLKRKKRGIKVKKISKIKTKTNVKRYFPKTAKKIYIKKTNSRRNKRQIDKIRIVARDHSPRRSSEDVFVVSDENEFSNRAVVREEPESNNQGEENFDYGSPYAYDRPDYASTIFSGRSRHNALMSKYPHVFLDETSRPKDETAEMPFYNQYTDKTSEIKREAVENKSNLRESPNKMEDPESDYKITVKISPKNESMHAGFKEVHTSINKSISKNGLLYSSLVNVSEFSRIENVNKSDEISSSTLSPLVSHIKEQQERMKYLLRQHRMKIDEQLDHLQKEKLNLDSIMVAKNIAKSSEMIDFVLPSNPPKLLHLSKKEASELLSSAFMKMQDTPHLNYVTSTTPTAQSTTAPTTASTTPLTTTTKPITIKPTTLDPEKLITTIQRSESLTNKILNKIDKNTELLQTFLQKLYERIETTTKSEPKQEILVDHQRDYRDYIHDPFFVQTMPNMEITKNDTHVSIPFVYAYQQPYPLPNKPNTPVASVVYQGHIHTNTLHRNFNQAKEGTEFKKPNLSRRDNIPINQNAVNLPINHQINQGDIKMPQRNQRDIKMLQINQRENMINMPQMNHREINMSKMNQREINMPQMNQRELNMPQINQRENLINMPQINQRNMGIPQMNQRENIVLPLNETRFFIDNVENNFKLMPVRNSMKPFMGDNVNSTNGLN